MFLLFRFWFALQSIRGLGELLASPAVSSFLSSSILVPREDVTQDSLSQRVLCVLLVLSRRFDV